MRILPIITAIAVSFLSVAWQHARPAAGRHRGQSLRRSALSGYLV